MDHTKLALLAAIRAAPKDNAPRLIFADWLEENGAEERAQFVRAHLLHPERCPAFGKMIWRLLGDELGELCTHRHGRGAKRQFGYAGTATVLVGNQFSKIRVILDRGFVTEVRTTLAVFIDHCRSVMKDQPVCTWSLTDRLPTNSSNGEHVWLHVRDVQLNLPSRLPTDLHRLLDGSKSCGSTTESAIYASATEAKSALERACLRYALSEQSG
jgi:uncharacterized protein (TIGR02996 family)